MSLLPPILEGRISNFHEIWEDFWWCDQISFPNFFPKYSFNYLWGSLVVENPIIIPQITRNPSQISSRNIPSNICGEEFLVVENPKISLFKKKIPWIFLPKNVHSYMKTSISRIAGIREVLQNQIFLNHGYIMVALININLKASLKLL